LLNALIDALQGVELLRVLFTSEPKTNTRIEVIGTDIIVARNKQFIHSFVATGSTPPLDGKMTGFHIA
jgi:hypothetical protein